MSEQEQQLFIASGKLISITEAALESPYSPEYLSLRARQGKLRAVKIGRNWLTTHEAVFEYLKNQESNYQRLAGRLKKFQTLQRRAV